MAIGHDHANATCVTETSTIGLACNQDSGVHQREQVEFSVARFVWPANAGQPTRARRLPEKGKQPRKAGRYGISGIP